MDGLIQCHEVTTFMLNLFRSKLAEVTEAPGPAIITEKPPILSSTDEADCHDIVAVLVVAFLHPGKIVTRRRVVYSSRTSFG